MKSEELVAFPEEISKQLEQFLTLTRGEINVSIKDANKAFRKLLNYLTNI